MRVSLNVVHAPWIEARAESMAKLRLRLGLTDHKGCSIDDAKELGLVAYAEETTRAPKAWWVWHELQLRWSLEQDVEWCLFGQDDIVTPPATEFFAALETLLPGTEHDVVCFHNGHPGARTVFMKDKRPGYTTCDGMVGQFYGVRRRVLEDLLGWLEHEIHIERAHKLNEDVLTGLFCMDRGLPIFHPVPTLYDHALDIPSTNEGFDEHIYRAPQVLWTDAARAGVNIFDRDFWTAPPIHFGRFYETLHTYAPLVLRDTKRGEELLAKYATDVCPKAYRRYFHRIAT